MSSLYLLLTTKLCFLINLLSFTAQQTIHNLFIGLLLYIQGMPWQTISFEKDRAEHLFKFKQKYLYKYCPKKLKQLLLKNDPAKFNFLNGT